MPFVDSHVLFQPDRNAMRSTLLNWGLYSTEASDKLDIETTDSMQGYPGLASLDAPCDGAKKRNPRAKVCEPVNTNVSTRIYIDREVTVEFLYVLSRSANHPASGLDWQHWRGGVDNADDDYECPRQ